MKFNIKIRVNDPVGVVQVQWGGDSTLAENRNLVQSGLKGFDYILEANPTILGRGLVIYAQQPDVHGSRAGLHVKEEIVLG